MKQISLYGFVLFVVPILFVVSALAQTQTNLIARWSFDEGTGTNVAAVSGAEACQPQAGSRFNGILEGSPLPVWTNGLGGWALLFDGQQNQVTINSRKDAQDTQTGTSSCAFCDFSRLTVSAWIRAAAGTSGEIVAKWNTNGLAQGTFMLSLTNGVPCFELRTAGISPQRHGEQAEVGIYRVVVGASGRTDGQWHFVASTYDGKQMGIWWDGKLDGSLSVSGTVESVDAPLQIGLVNAVVDEVSIWNRALSATELLPLFNADRDGDGWPDYWMANHPRLTGGMPGTNWMNQGSSNVGSNQTGNGNLSAPRRKERVWYVNALTGNNARTGRTEAQAKKEVGATARVAADGDAIVIAAGVYHEKFAGHGNKTIILHSKGTVIFR